MSYMISLLPIHWRKPMKNSVTLYSMDTYKEELVSTNPRIASCHKKPGSISGCSRQYSSLQLCSFQLCWLLLLLSWRQAVKLWWQGDQKHPQLACGRRLGNKGSRTCVKTQNICYGSACWIWTRDRWSCGFSYSEAVHILIRHLRSIFFFCEKWAEYCAWDQNGSVEALWSEEGNDVQITAGDTTSYTYSSGTLHHLALPILYFSLCLSC